MRPKKNKPEQNNDSHRWVVSYADFITLLFAFFVVMYAISSINVSKYKSLSDGMKSAFNKKDQAKATQSTDNKLDGPNVTQSHGNYKDGLDELNKSLSELATSDFKINRQDGWIEMDIKSGSLFDSGTADLKPEAFVKLMALAEKIKRLPFPVIIEGYTDNMPIETPQYPSNWELSAARAATVARVLNGYGINMERLLVTGYGEQYPIFDNLTEEGRNQNRRVNIVIAKDRSVDRVVNPLLGHVQNHIFIQAPVETKPETEQRKKNDNPHD